MKMSSRTRTSKIDFKTLVLKHDPPTPNPYPVYQFTNNRCFKDRRDPGRLRNCGWRVNG